MSDRILADTTRDPEEDTLAGKAALTPQSRLVPEKITLSETASMRQPWIAGKVLRAGMGRDAVCTSQARSCVGIDRYM